MERFLALQFLIVLCTALNVVIRAVASEMALPAPPEAIIHVPLTAACPSLERAVGEILINTRVSDRIGRLSLRLPESTSNERELTLDRLEQLWGKADGLPGIIGGDGKPPAGYFVFHLKSTIDPTDRYAVGGKCEAFTRDVRQLRLVRLRDRSKGSFCPKDPVNCPTSRSQPSACHASVPLQILPTPDDVASAHGAVLDDHLVAGKETYNVANWLDPKYDRRRSLTNLLHQTQPDIDLDDFGVEITNEPSSRLHVCFQEYKLWGGQVFCYDIDDRFKIVSKESHRSYVAN